MKCGDAGWSSSPPQCECWQGSISNVARMPPSAHASKRFDGVEKDCPLYVWHHGCDFLGKLAARACPHQGCKHTIAFCWNHGGDERAVKEMWRHVQEHYVLAAVS
jgi:hypothetical protein